MNVGQGNTIKLYAYFKDPNGNMVDPVTPKVTIKDPNDTTIIDAADPTKENTGVYYYNFAVDNDALLGAWSAVWSGLVNGSTITASEVFTVVEPGVIEWLDSINSNPADPQANSYASMDEANVYFANYYYGDEVWISAPANIKTIALKNATRIMQRMRYFKDKIYDFQILAFPRADVPLGGASIGEVISDTKFRTTSLKSDTLVNENYKWCGIRFVTGENKNQFATIVDYDPINGEIQINAAMPNSFTAGDTFELIPMVQENVKFAQCEIARSLIAGTYNKGRAKLQAEGVKSYTLGDLSETFEGAKLITTAMPKEAEDLLSPYICKTGYII